MSGFYTNKTFFEGKRPWSKMKDQILGKYLPVYLTKVSKLGKPIIIVDCFAGPGIYEDNETGSPVQICNLVEQHSISNFKGYFGNKDILQHEKLTSALDKYIKTNKAHTINTTAEDLLSSISKNLKDETILIYLDPFGIKDLDFKMLIPFLERDKNYSTEIIINLSIPPIHRLSGKYIGRVNPKTKLKDWEYLYIFDGVDIREEITPQMKRHRELLLQRKEIITKILGGNYWEKHLYNDAISAKEQIEKTISDFQNLIRKYVNIVGACPVYEGKEESAIKYYIIFASRHIDSAVLLNDFMFDSYWNHIWKSESEGTLFETLGFEEKLPADYYTSLKKLIREYLETGEKSRRRIWEAIVLNRFMKYKSSDYIRAVQELYQQKIVQYKDTRGTGRLNDDSILYLRK